MTPDHYTGAKSGVLQCTDDRGRQWSKGDDREVHVATSEVLIVDGFINLVHSGLEYTNS